MLKHIPKSDINLRPFKVYKTFTFTEKDVAGLFAYNHTGSTDYLSDTELDEQGLYHQLHTMYYRDPHNPFTSYGDINPISESFNSITSQRYLDGAAYVLPIKQKYYGEGIKPGSVILNSNVTADISVDDTYGNLISDTNVFTLISLNIESGIFTFVDIQGNQNSLTFTSINMDDGILVIQGQTNNFINFTANITDDLISFVGIIEGNASIARNTIGNVFYSHGIITITKGIDTYNKNYFNDYELEYKSTNTIYENEYLLVVGEDEFNVSTNPTSYTEMNIETGSIYVTNSNILYEIVAGPDAGGFINYYDQNNQEQLLFIEPNNTYNFYANSFGDNELINCSFIESDKAGVKWRNSDKYQKTTFGEYEYSSSIDPIGSYLAPYITTIGLYDENMDMVAVAKLAKPVKSMPDLPVNFLVRFDT
jgi:hypothetical protein